jgi:hypothetical protein
MFTAFGRAQAEEPNPQDASPSATRKSESEKDGPPKDLDPNLAHLDFLAGSWSFVETHFDRNGETSATVRGKEEIRWILNYAAIQRTYTSGSGEKSYHAIGTITYNHADKKYNGAWFDNVSKTGPTGYQGEWEASARSLVGILESKALDGSAVRHKVVESFVDPETRVFTSYRLEGKDVIKTLEVRAKRTSACPSSIRMLFDE